MRVLAFCVALVFSIMFLGIQVQAQGLKKAKVKSQQQATVKPKSPVKELPPKVEEALKAKYPKAKVLKYKEVRPEKGEPFYRVVVDNNGMISSIDFNIATGKVIKEHKGDLLGREEKVKRAD